MLFLAVAHREPNIPVIELHNVKVQDEVGQYAYWMELESGHRVYMLFCNDQPEPPWNEGEILDLLRVQEVGNCLSMRDLHPRWINRRDADGNEYHFKNKAQSSTSGTAAAGQAN